MTCLLLLSLSCQLLTAHPLPGCQQPKLLNVSKYPWVIQEDQANLDYCIKRCPELYPDAKCLKLFRKYNKQQYTCLCTKAINERK